MRKSVFVVAALIAAVSTAAVAKEVKQEKRAGPVQMTDSEMDKVTAGTKTDNNGNAFGAGMGGGSIKTPGQGINNANPNARFLQ